MSATTDVAIMPKEQRCLDSWDPNNSPGSWEPIDSPSTPDTPTPPTDYTAIYAAKPLPQDVQSTRFITIQRNSNGGISVSLHVHDLAATVPWTALSHVWRPHWVDRDDEFRTIDLDDQSFEIGVGLFEALNALPNEGPKCNSARKKYSQDQDILQAMPEWSESRFFWIDAICINQADLRERGEQVLLMKYLYSEAELVIAWLTPSLEHLRNGFFLGEGHNDVISLNTYWTRMWILQEFILARQLVFLYCDVWISPAFVEQLDSGTDFTRLKYRQIYQCRMNRASDSTSAESRIMRLPNLLREFENRACADDRDRVYALLGILPDEYHIIRPNYDKAYLEVMADAIYAETEVDVEGSGYNIDDVDFQHTLVRLLGLWLDPVAYYLENEDMSQLPKRADADCRTLRTVDNWLVETSDGHHWLRRFALQHSILPLAWDRFEKLRLRAGSRIGTFCGIFTGTPYEILYDATWSPYRLARWLVDTVKGQGKLRLAILDDSQSRRHEQEYIREVSESVEAIRIQTGTSIDKVLAMVRGTRLEDSYIPRLGSVDSYFDNSSRCLQVFMAELIVLNSLSEISKLCILKAVR